jgi:hypothetical protein
VGPLDARGDDWLVEKWSFWLGTKEPEGLPDELLMMK